MILKYERIRNLREDMDMTQTEIAKMLNKPVGTIMWQYNEALKEIRKFLKNND